MSIKERLTSRQIKFLNTISELQSMLGEWPTYREISAAMGFKSPNAVSKYYEALERKGFLKKMGSHYQFDTTKHSMGMDGIPIKGTRSAGRAVGIEGITIGKISLKSFFSEYENLYALRILTERGHPKSVTIPDFILLTEKDDYHEQVCVVIYRGMVSVQKVVGDPDEDVARDQDDARRILGQYAGYITDRCVSKEVISLNLNNAHFARLDDGSLGQFTLQDLFPKLDKMFAIASPVADSVASYWLIEAEDSSSKMTSNV